MGNGSDTFFSFFKNLFSNEFMPHGHCYFWRPEIVWLNVISDGLIALSYYAIPIILLFFMAKRKDFPYPWILAMFGAFILLCGTTHIMSIIVLWDPIYRLDGLIKAATAVASVITTIMLIPLVPLALALRSPKELEAANQKLALANDQLKEIDRLKDSFFSNISHELRTPLTLILAPLESLLANDYGSLNDVQHKNLEAMHNNSIRLFQMVNSILDFAKISAKKTIVKRDPLDIVLLTKSIAQEFEVVAKQKHIQIAFQCSLSKKIVSIDRYLYERIIFNLLSNAVKFTPENGSITITLNFDGDKTTLAIKDTGIGISDSNQKKLFQRFQQVEGSATRRFEGTGLGLALVKEFSLLLGGDVTVQSKQGEGSTFTVELQAPAAENEAVVTKPLESKFQKYLVSSPEFKFESTGQANQEAPKILIAEDNLELANYTSSLLNEFAQTKHAADGEQAWQLVNTWNPNLVILDVMMPKRDGISVCQEIKTNTKTSHIPVILLTALTHRDALVRGWEAGADEYLFKPFHPKEFLTRVKLLLANAHNSEEVKELNRKLIIAARQAGMSEVARSIMHNVGNILNSVNVSTNILLEKISHSEIEKIGLLSEWVKDNFKNPSELVKNKEKQTDLINYLKELNDVLIKEKDTFISEVMELRKYILNINNVVALQERVEGAFGVVEEVEISGLIDDALTLNIEKKDNIHVIKNYDDTVKARLDKMKLQQIIMHLIQNAKDSLLASQQKNKQLTIKTHHETKEGKKYLEIKIVDNGLGITPDHLKDIFTFGFTTKSHGTGFGLHVSFLSAKEMGGKLAVKSEGDNCGATFILTLPTEPVEAANWVSSD